MTEKWKFEDGDYVVVEQGTNERRFDFSPNNKVRFIQFRERGQSLIVNIVECTKEDAAEVMAERGISKSYIRKGESHLSTNFYVPPKQMYLKDVNDHNYVAIPEEATMCYLLDAEWVEEWTDTDGIMAVIENGKIVHTNFVAYVEDGDELAALDKLRNIIDNVHFIGDTPPGDLDTDKIKVARINPYGDEDNWFYAWYDLS